MDELSVFRKRINIIDRKLLKLLYQRMEIVKNVGEFKAKNGIPVVDRKRENDILEKISILGENYNLDKKDVKKIWREIFRMAYKYE